MFRTAAQKRASRENGAKSHGPVTPEGKQTSSRNATKHGLFSAAVLHRPANRDTWNRIARELSARFRPVGGAELALIEDMAISQWRKDRAVQIETAVLESECAALGQNETPEEIRGIAIAWTSASGRTSVLADLARQILRLVNFWMRLHRKLKDLQAARKAAATTPSSSPREKSKFEPGIGELLSFQSRTPNRPAAVTAPASPSRPPSRPPAGGGRLHPGLECVIIQGTE